ncbi:hypothetical protein BJ165DRAFT_1520458 [Panaeolus papilionaceus]|nr:hypothetical protein BJ165DRAFT_1520458 [Panaeolus papilionaceus]
MPPYSITRKQFKELHPKLPVAFWPPGLRKKEVTWRDEEEWMETLVFKELPGYKHLPPGLYLRKGTQLQPPHFLYGWPVSDERLAEIARHRGFSLKTSTGPDDPGVPPSMHVYVVSDRIRRLLREQHPETMNARAVNVGLDLIYYEPDKPLVIAIADAYRCGNTRPSEECVEVLREWFGFGEEEEPMWYLSATKWNWRWEDSAGLERVWGKDGKWDDPPSS